MEKFSVYPAGAQGIALLALRTSLACAVASRALLPAPPLPSAILIVLVASLLIGALFRLAAICAVALAVVGLAASDFAAAIDLLDAAAAFVLGPGAFSLDARLFGRRVIRIADRTPPSRPNPDG